MGQATVSRRKADSSHQEPQDRAGRRRRRAGTTLAGPTETTSGSSRRPRRPGLRVSGTAAYAPSRGSSRRWGSSRRSAPQARPSARRRHVRAGRGAPGGARSGESESADLRHHHQPRLLRRAMLERATIVRLGDERHGRQEKVADLARGLLGRLDRAGEGLSERGRGRVVRGRGRRDAQHACGASCARASSSSSSTYPCGPRSCGVSEHYRGAVNEELGEELVRTIRFTVSERSGERRIGGDGEAIDLSYREDEPVPADEIAARTHRSSRSASVIKDEEVRRQR